MTRSELDHLVHGVGDELLARLGLQPGGAGLDTPSGGGASAVEAKAAAGRSISDGPQACNACPDWMPPEQGIAGLIDHALLRPDAAEAEVAAVCAEARRHRFAAVCVQPGWVALAARELRGSAVRTCAVVGFPHGATLTPVKCSETEHAIRLGADEIDVALMTGALKSGDEDRVYVDIRCVAELAHSAKRVLKVVLESALLDDREKVVACVLAKLAGADFVATSTGFGPAGASPRDIALMHRTVGGEMGIKAAGGISTYAHMVQMMQAGATRIGSSSSLGIAAQAEASGVVPRSRG